MFRGLLRDVYLAIADFNKEDEREIRDLKQEVARLKQSIENQESETRRIATLNVELVAEKASLQAQIDALKASKLDG